MDSTGLLSFLPYVGYAVLAVIALSVFIGSMFTVHTMQAGLVERLGKFLRIAEPGLNFKVPFSVCRGSEESI